MYIGGSYFIWNFPQNHIICVHSYLCLGIMMVLILKCPPPFTYRKALLPSDPQQNAISVFHLYCKMWHRSIRVGQDHTCANETIVFVAVPVIAVTEFP